MCIVHDRQMSLVEDVNTGQLVPAAVSKDRTDAPQPAEHGLFEAEVASTKKSSGVTSTGEVSNMPPRGTPCRRVLLTVDFKRSPMVDVEVLC